MKFEAGQFWKQRDGRINKIENIRKDLSYGIRMSDGTGRDEYGNYWDHYQKDYRDLIELVESPESSDNKQDTAESIKKNITIREIKLNSLDEFTNYIEINRDEFKIEDDLSNLTLISSNKFSDILNGCYFIVTFSVIE